MDMNLAGSRNRGPDRRVRIARWVPRGDVHGDDIVGVRTADSPANDPTTSDSAFNAADATAQWEEAQNKVDRFFLEPEASPEATRAEAKRLVEELLLAKEAEIRLKKEKETIATRAAANEALLAEETQALLEQQRAAIGEIIDEEAVDAEDEELDELLATVEDEVRELTEELAETLGPGDATDCLEEVETVAKELSSSDEGDLAAVYACDETGHCEPVAVTSVATERVEPERLNRIRRSSASG